MKTLIATSSDALDKVVTDVKYYDGWLAVHFEGNTSMVFKASAGYHGDPCELEPVVYENNIPEYEAFQLGLINRDEYDVKQAARRDAYDRQREAQDARQLEKLAKQFGLKLYKPEDK